MNGAQTLIRTLTAAGIEVCFANPGTSEMHFVAALDTVPQMRAVLALFEGAVTGAADGYGRMAGRPAATLLHLGPGLANGLANLHNAKRARTPLVNVIGDHATYHKPLDAPLESDVQGHARLVSHWVRTCEDGQALASDTAAAVAAARSAGGQIASLILPADISWGQGGPPATPIGPATPRPVPSGRVEASAAALRSGEPCALLLGGGALQLHALQNGARVAAQAGAKFLCETFPARLTRGAGLPPIERLAYLGEMVLQQLQGIRHLILVGTKSPVSFFAYPGKPSELVPPGTTVHTLATVEEDAAQALADLATELRAGPAPSAELQRPEPGTGALTPESIARTLGALLPEQAIVSDEGNTLGFLAPFFTANAPPHDWLTLTGGAIGQGIPLATGAAIACPERRVINLEADGSAMYTLQALWTQAREQLPVTTIILNNGAYGILNMELARVGVDHAGDKARAMLDLTRPPLDFVALARGLGVPASRATTADELQQQLARSLSQAGPSLIDALCT